MSWFAAPACGAVARPFSWTARYAPGHRALRVGQLTTSSPRTKQKQWTVTCSSSSDRFAFVQPGAPDGRNRGDLAVGMEVDIVLKQDQGSGRLTRGVVREFLTNSRFHPQGIKVRLVDGGIGRVEVVVGGGDDDPETATDTPSETHRTQKQSPHGTEPGASTREIGGPSNAVAAGSPKQSNGAASAKHAGEENAEAKSPEPEPAARPPSTVYLSNLPKALSKTDVSWLIGEIPGVTGLRLPKRGGNNMGYSFIACRDLASADAVISLLNGMELEGKSLVAERARSATRDDDNDQAAGFQSRGSKGSRSSGTKQSGADTRDTNSPDKNQKKKGKQWKRDETTEHETHDETLDEDPSETVDPILVARAEMESEAIMHMERARRAARKQMERATEIAAERLEKEANAERRTTALLAERAARAAAAAAAAIAKRDREESVRQEAIGLGPVTVDPQWEVELASLAEELAALRASVE